MQNVGAIFSDYLSYHQYLGGGAPTELFKGGGAQWACVRSYVWSYLRYAQGGPGYYMKDQVFLGSLIVDESQ